MSPEQWDTRKILSLYYTYLVMVMVSKPIRNSIEIEVNDDDIQAGDKICSVSCQLLKSNYITHSVFNIEVNNFPR